MIKNILVVTGVAIITFSCSKKENAIPEIQANNAKVDSINAERTKTNDSIKAINSKNRFKDFGGSHKFTYQTQDVKKMIGTVEFKKIEGERDHYDILGGIQSGNNTVHIKGFMQVVSAKYMNFTGEITQKISENDHGKPYTRKGTKTFMSKDGGKTWRLQDMVNGSGFVDYIEIQ